MAHSKHPQTREIVHHWMVGTDIIHLHPEDEGYYIGKCKVRRCKEVKYFPSNPTVSYQSSWRKMRDERERREKFKVK